MRKLERPPEPEVLQLKSAQWNQQWVELRRKNPSAQFTWYSHKGKTVRDWLVDELREMTQSHCTFCDAWPMDDQSLESIEHFRPKHDERFQHLAFTWTNLYYCCDKCQNLKRGQWEDELIAPDEAGYEFEDFFEFEVSTGVIAPNRCARPEIQKRAEATIRIYGLNEGRRPFRRCHALARWQNDKAQNIHDTAYRNFIEAASLRAAEAA
jgi:uncharacterized protein (TIGR02646 family)